MLDRLLERDRLEIAAVSGTPAGALNGAPPKAGLMRGRRAISFVKELVAEGRVPRGR